MYDNSVFYGIAKENDWRLNYNVKNLGTKNFTGND